MGKSNTQDQDNTERVLLGITKCENPGKMLGWTGNIPHIDIEKNPLSKNEIRDWKNSEFPSYELQIHHQAGLFLEGENVSEIYGIIHHSKNIVEIVGEIEYRRRVC